MNGCVIYKCILIFIIQCVYSSDRPSNTHGTEDDTEDNFDVVDVTSQPGFIPGVPVYPPGYEPNQPIQPTGYQTIQPTGYPPNYPPGYQPIRPVPPIQPIRPVPPIQPIRPVPPIRPVHPVHQIPYPQVVVPGVPLQQVYPGPPPQIPIVPPPQRLPPPGYGVFPVPRPGFGIGYPPRVPISTIPGTVPWEYQPISGYFLVGGPVPSAQPTVPIQHYQPIQPQAEGGGVGGAEGGGYGDTEGGEGGEIDEDNFDMVVRDLETLDIERETQPDKEVVEYETKIPSHDSFRDRGLCGIYLSIVLYGRNQRNEYIELNTHQYEVLTDNEYCYRFVAKTPLCKVVCDGRNVWEHKPGSAHPNYFCFYKKEYRFAFYSEKLVDSCMISKKVWICKSKEIPQIKFYKLNAQNELVELNSKELIIDYNLIMTIRFKIVGNADCVLIKYNGETLWEKLDNMVLKGLTYIDDKSMRLYICHRRFLLRRINNEWVMKILPKRIGKPWNKDKSKRR